jgi:hypothetical protein
MYQQYPVADAPQEPQRAQQPPSVRNAVRLMYAGIVLLYSKESAPFFSRLAPR